MYFNGVTPVSSSGFQWMKAGNGIIHDEAITPIPIPETGDTWIAVLGKSTGAQ